MTLPPCNQSSILPARPPTPLKSIFFYIKIVFWVLLCSLTARTRYSRPVLGGVLLACTFTAIDLGMAMTHQDLELFAFLFITGVSLPIYFLVVTLALFFYDSLDGIILPVVLLAVCAFVTILVVPSVTFEMPGALTTEEEAQSALGLNAWAPAQPGVTGAARS